MTEELDIAALSAWVGRRDTRSDVVTAQLVSAYCATVSDQETFEANGDVAPPGIHWCLATPIAAMSALGPDGHPARGGFLPPIPLPRRMWAGSRVEFLAPLRVGDEVERRSTIKSVEPKTGRSGQLVFVTVEHVYRTPDGDAVREEQDLVFREAAATETPRPSEQGETGPPRPDGTRRVDPSPVLLFRFSALTFNGHRIHYDRRYAMEVESYPGLVVHGPLQAALLVDLAASMRDGAAPRRFEFRAQRPLFDDRPFVLSGRWLDGSALALSSGVEHQPPAMVATARW
jgi:3-methylfumaryl-CoA hydratase